MDSLTVNLMKCACESCLCIVDTTKAIQKGEKNYCSEICANGHPNGEGCSHSGCQCHG